MQCPVCQEPGKSSCSACPQVQYCSVQHQKEHWKIHKKSCSPFIIKKNPELGTHWVAARNLKPGTILLDESPAFHAPQWNSMDLTSGTCCCVSCGIVMNNKKRKRCSVCGWPVCSHECEKLPIHTENECKVFAAKKIKFLSSSPFPPDDISWCLLMLRGVGLKSQNKSLYEETINLLHIHQVPSAHVDVNQVCDTHYQRVLKILGPLEHDAEEYKRILRLTLINGFSAGGSTVTAVYPKASRINHSCTPNCTREIGPRSDFKIRICTSVPIKKGEQITVTYYNGQTFQGTTQRQKSMRAGRGCGGFVCRCSRCLDPSEFGTMISGITCRECQELGRVNDDNTLGYYLPLDPLDLAEDAKWECNGCGTVELASTFNPILSKLELMVKFGSMRFADRMEYAGMCEGLIHDYGGSVLHPNHWIVQEASEAILDVIDEVEQINQNALERYVELALYLLAIRDKITPGISADKDVLQRQTSKALTTLIRHFSQTMEKTKVMEHLELCKKLQEELWKFQKNDISCNRQDNETLMQEMNYINILSNAYANK